MRKVDEDEAALRAIKEGREDEATTTGPTEAEAFVLKPAKLLEKGKFRLMRSTTTCGDALAWGDSFIGDDLQIVSMQMQHMQLHHHVPSTTTRGWTTGQGGNGMAANGVGNMVRTRVYVCTRSWY